MRFEHQGKAAFRHLDRTELDPTGRVPLTYGGITVTGGRASAAGTGLEHMPDETPPGAWVSAIQSNAQPPSPTSHRPLRAGLGQGHYDRFDDLIRAMTGAHRDRRTLARPDDGALPEHHLERPQRAVVLGDLVIDQKRERHRNGGLRVGMRGIDEP